MIHLFQSLLLSLFPRDTPVSAPPHHTHTEAWSRDVWWLCPDRYLRLTPVPHKPERPVPRTAEASAEISSGEITKIMVRRSTLSAPQRDIERDFDSTGALELRFQQLCALKHTADAVKVKSFMSLVPSEPFHRFLAGVSNKTRGYTQPAQRLTALGVREYMTRSHFH